MCRSMADIQSTAAEIRRGKKEDRRKKKKETTGQKYNGPPILHRAAIKNNPKYNSLPLSLKRYAGDCNNSILTAATGEQNTY